ncbi:hypothetical protein RchiOBHm_Chr1g0368071 [Rosa chinensis]|uniref:Uncharacterized protein n=1 Tax=Rosa chinensis TaxID=74649 RepID=A0A2P6SKN8_ROSCH|nr:hypothetical protein RchiOBHm_Chr1g0368071 [Rosa chinensis]
MKSVHRKKVKGSKMKILPSPHTVLVGVTSKPPRFAADSGFLKSEMRDEDFELQHVFESSGGPSTF